MGSRKRHLFFFAAVVIVSAAAPRPAAACSCVGSRPACQAFWDPGGVFAGKVAAIETHSSGGAAFVERRVRFEVLEAFTGVSGSTVDVYTGNGGGDCGYAFVVGGTYLVYAYQATGSPWLTTGICSRTRRLSEAAEDLAYLRGVPESGPLGATILGKVYDRDRNTAREPGAVVLGGASGLRVLVNCEGLNFSAITDRDGRFRIQGVPVGRCTARADSPDYVLIPSSPVELVDPRACAVMTLQVGRSKR